MNMLPVRYHDDPKVNGWVRVLLYADFGPPSPYLPIGAERPAPMTFGETLLQIADQFGRDAAIKVRLAVH